MAAPATASGTGGGAAGQSSDGVVLYADGLVNNTGMITGGLGAARAST